MTDSEGEGKWFVRWRRRESRAIWNERLFFPDEQSARAHSDSIRDDRNYADVAVGETP